LAENILNELSDFLPKINNQNWTDSKILPYI